MTPTPPNERPNPGSSGVEPSPESGIRTFLALDLSPAVRAHIAELIERLRKGIQFTGAKPAWVKPGNIHLTLHFLGKITPEAIEAMKPRLDAVAAQFPAPEIDVRTLGTFPNERTPKVLWIGIPKPDRSLLGLQEALLPVVAEAGAKIDTRPYHPHLTLARIKAMRGTRGMMSVVESHKRFQAGMFQPRELVLYRSDLHPDGAIYTPLHRSPLKAPE